MYKVLITNTLAEFEPTTFRSSFAADDHYVQHDARAAHKYLFLLYW
jgi:hypothetical protein